VSDDDSVGQLAELYLGNILYALELAAMSLDEQKKPTDAAFYRGIGRKLAEAHGRAKSRAAPPGRSGQ
jgi:hypothetical protein